MPDNDTHDELYDEPEAPSPEESEPQGDAEELAESAGTHTGPDPETHEDYAEDNYDLDAHARQAAQLEAAREHFA